ncbi:syntaxin-5 isoform X1 [Hydra vulgaris]|uniref:Syntaxin-5 n=1 Tax=Hydra vulgaris TaxID=6087 RepID=T2ME80_HYDVU|nr:syntaxin-5 [Hydra vulgaris]
MSTVRRRTKSVSKEEKYLYTPNYSSRDYKDTVESYSVSNIDSVDMSCRDRTVEFLSAVKSLQSRQVNGYKLNQRQNGRVVNPSQFTLLSRQISQDIGNTFSKLEKLAILAKQKSLFNDKPVEIQELTYIIKQDINHLNQQIASLQQIAQNKDSSSSKNVKTHSHTVVMSLQSKLANMSKDFKHVLEVRTENMKQQKNRREQFSQGALTDNMHISELSGNSLLNRPLGNNEAVALDMEPLLSQHQQVYDHNDEYIKSRATAMESIESTIVELGGIFQQLAHLVSEQEEQIKRIDSNVEDTEMNVEAAHSELLKYFQSISSNRWLIIKIFFVLIVFFVVFVLFMA